MTTAEMSSTSAVPTDVTLTQAYRDAISSATDEDRECAGAVAADLIEVVKAFNAVKVRINGPGHPDNLDHALLARLAKTGPMRASDLAEHLCFDPSTVSRQVSGLVKAGLIARQADPNDGRASILVPTEAGRERIERMARLRGDLFAPLIAHWSAGDRADFARLLADFANTLSTNLEAVKNVAAETIGPNTTPRTSPSNPYSKEN